MVARRGYRMSAEHAGGRYAQFPFWRVLGALVLGALLARWSWLLLAPRPTVASVALERGAEGQAERLFGTAVSGAAASAATVLPNVALVGVFAPGSGRSGFAVLKLDGNQQVGVVVGENVADGARLLEVHPDHVLLESGGMRQRVDMEGQVAGTSK
jgi:type II secretory pathway component PulC